MSGQPMLAKKPRAENHVLFLREKPLIDMRVRTASQAVSVTRRMTCSGCLRNLMLEMLGHDVGSP